MRNVVKYLYNNVSDKLAMPEGEMTMKIKNIQDIEGLFIVIDQCEGRVELVTEDGDRLNLKSRLSQYVALVNVFADSSIGEFELIAYNDADIARLTRFIVEDSHKQD